MASKNNRKSVARRGLGKQKKIQDVPQWERHGYKRQGFRESPSLGLGHLTHKNESLQSFRSSRMKLLNEGWGVAQ